jgi:2-amino-4-hydroxy-6-hydroxymethyldihydropteridine diphosphokinase
MPRVGIALGSNLGDRLANLQAAREALREINTLGATFLQAATYQTEPLHCPPDSPFFYNSVVDLAYEGTPFELLGLTQSIEIKLGRIVHHQRNAPRIIDVDLLYFGDQIIDTETLVLPHPRIAERRFVLQPLADIRPDLILPGSTRSISRLLETLSSQEPSLVQVSTANSGYSQN